MVDRFTRDGKRFPVGQYSRHNLVWHDDLWRPLLATEREQLMGFPERYTAGLTETCAQGQDQKSLEDRRCSAIGNTFHVPSW